jgi:SAM-dependent methyltransferase
MFDALSRTSATASPEAAASALPPLTLNASLRWDVVSRLLPARPGAVLEVGCGRGAAAARIARRAERLVGCEPDAHSFAMAKSNIGAVASVYNCMSSQLPDAYRFDTICAFEVLEHIEDDAEALAEWFDKLHPGGSLVLSVPARQTRFAAADRIAGHFRRYEPREMSEKLELTGFTDIHVELYGFPAGHLLEAFRNIVAARMLKQGAGDLDIAERTAGSGRLLQPGNGWIGLAIALVARPLVWLQRLFPNRGVGLVARARRPS